MPGAEAEPPGRGGRGDIGTLLLGTGDAVFVWGAAGLLWGVVRTTHQLSPKPHVVPRGVVQQIARRGGGRMTQLGRPVKLSATPASLRRPAPTFGQHTAEVLEELGYARAAIA